MKRIGYIDGRRLSLLNDLAISLGTDRDVTITPSDGGQLTIASEWTEPGATGRPLQAKLTTNVSLGSYANAFKAYVDLQSAGGAVGLLSASCHEVLMALVGIAGTIAAVEMEIVYGATCGLLPQPAFMYMNTDGTAKGDFDSVGDLLKVGDGLSAGAGKMLSVDSNTLRVGINEVHRYLPLSLSENILDYDVDAIAANGRIAKFTGDWEEPTLGDGQGLFEIAISVTGEAVNNGFLTSTRMSVADAASILAAGGYYGLHSDVLYEDVAATITNTYLCWARFQAILGDDDFKTFNLWNLNLTQSLTAIFEVNDRANMGLIVGVHTDAVYGSIPFLTTNGVQPLYVRVYADATS